jgi:ABC-type branched-subunit amino acid transport system substrate-binding protein
MKLLSLTLLASAAAILAAGAAAAQDKEPIKIGVIYPITGGGAVYGVPAMQGHDLAVEELNAKGGILGRKVVSVARDGKLNPADASAAMKEIITSEKVDVVIGAVASSIGLALSQVSKQESMPYISTIPKSIQITTTELHPWVFRTASNTDFEGDAMAQMVKQVGGKKICNVELDYAYGHDLTAGIKKALPKYAPDAKIVLEMSPKLGATDYNAYITQIMGSDCDTVTSSMWGNNFINFAKQAKPFGLFNKVKFIGGGEVASHEVAGKMGADYPDNVWSNTYELWYYDPSEAAKKFHAALAKKLGTKETPMWPVLAYNGVMFYAAAVEKAGTTDKEAVRKALEGLTIETPIGKLTIDAKSHQANTGQYWGPMKKKAGADYRVMDPITWVPPPGAGS